MIRRALLILLLASLSTSAQAAFDIDQLMSDLARFEGGRARFVETRTLALLDAPVRSSGELRFVPPDRLEKHTLLPRSEVLVLDKNELTVERDGRTMTWQVGNRPEAMAFIESLRGTLSGNRVQLEKYYRLQLQGSADDWTLVLLPTTAQVQALLKRIRVQGSGHLIRHITYEQTDGDRSDLAIEALTP